MVGSGVALGGTVALGSGVTVTVGSGVNVGGTGVGVGTHPLSKTNRTANANRAEMIFFIAFSPFIIHL
jgi:hypothetical protein